MFHHLEFSLILTLVEVATGLIVLGNVLLQLLSVLLSQSLVFLELTPDALLLYIVVVLVLFNGEVLDLLVEVLKDTAVKIFNTQALKQQGEGPDTVLVQLVLQISYVAFVVVAYLHMLQQQVFIGLE